MNRWIPDTIAARTLLALILGLTISHAISVGLYITDRTTALMFSGGEHIGERIATIDRLIRNSSETERQRLVEIADDPRLHVTWTQESAVDDQQEGGWQANVLRNALIAHLSHGGERTFRLHHMGGMAMEPMRDPMTAGHMGGPPGETMMVSLPLPDKSWLNFVAPIETPEPFWSLRFGLSMLVMLLAVAILSALVVRHLTKPLATFARAAQRLGVDVKAPPLPASGPAEVRQATRAFNEMQERIRRFVEDRTQMIAAISHDLGTPITRLRLRAEFVEDEEQQRKMLADLDDMERMVASALSFARDDATCEPRATVDLRTLLQRVCDDVSDAGHDVVVVTGDTAVPYACRPAAVRRAVSNLVENAVKYGQRARVSLSDTHDHVVVQIDDDGPGIPEDLHEDVFKPFRRLDASRNRETGGTGLGLTTARTIIRAHGGEIMLKNRQEGGLRAEVMLPR